MSVGDELKRYPMVYLIMFVGSGMLLLVNMLEGSFARSLVMCDTPVSTAAGQLFSGSAHCGDRGFVINEGQMISQTAQSWEMASKIIVMVVIAVFSDLYGRKFTLLIGLGATTLSVLLFLIGTQLPASSRWLFYMGQGLQGAFPMELIGTQIATDLASLDSTDSQGVFGAAGAATTLSQAVFAAILLCIQALELTDYTLVWFMTLFVNVGAFVVTLVFLPETRVQKADDKKTTQSFGRQVMGELADYRQLFEINGLGALMLTYVLKAIADAFMTLNQAVPMAYYGMKLDTVLLCFVPMILLSVVCAGVVPGMSAKMGERSAFWACNYFLFSANLLFLGVSFNPCFFFGPLYLFCVVFGGYEGMTGSMCTKFLGDKIAKYTALRSLSGYSLSIVTGPLYAYLFDAKASTWFDMTLPYLFSLSVRLLEFCVWFHPTLGAFRYMDAMLDLLTEERITVSAADSSKAADKKTD
eukprot:TRINITY_DN3033_c0_g1_i1.p1 TRINITY_DN3033_c0_g1~~TRINITY_DN3033_c0_g1_i1.p1  ORF type:complete len:512 (+),score=78.59 TRINITY_DN3033_c0_g1_i1:131-1537(+)